MENPSSDATECLQRTMDLKKAQMLTHGKLCKGKLLLN